MKYVIMLAVVLCLPGCEPKEKREARFMDKCEGAQFTHEQCSFLFVLAEDQKRGSDGASAMSAAAMGTAASAILSRR